MSVRRSIEIFLESAGMKFNSSDSTESFLVGAQPTVNDLLLLDINLDTLSGLDLLAKLDSENRNIPTIVITALNDMSTRERCKRYGVKAFLRKPVDGEALMDLINYHMTS